MGVINRVKRAWNAFTGNHINEYRDVGYGASFRQDRVRLTRGNERSIITSVYNRIALDVASIDIKHVRLDENKRYVSEIEDGLNNCLSLRANIDQTARAFLQDVVISMFDEGSVAIVPVDTTTDPEVSGSYDIETIRVGRILQWYPQHIQVRVYNEQTGLKEDIMISKKAAAIIENPLYAIMNEPNSTLQRLIRKLNLLDVVDEQSGSGKLDLIIQLPYIVKTEARRQQAENRRKDIEQQLSSSKYGIAYTDGTEHITQLNRSVNNNLMSQIEYLTNLLYSQLGITTGILDGTADEKTMLNYYNRTIEPIISAVVDEMRYKFLTKTARAQLQSIMFFRDPFKLVPVNDIAEIADKFTRNEIMTSNELRQIVGMRPSDDPAADELRNKNLSQSAGEQQSSDSSEQEDDNSSFQEAYDNALNELDDHDFELDKLEAELDADNDELKHYASEYYDPDKAHEYYMKHRNLKGRRSFASLNNDGKAAAKYVKNQLDTERKQKGEALKGELKSSLESLNGYKKAVMDMHNQRMVNAIAKLQLELENMSKEDKTLHKARILRQIDSLREDNDKVRKRLKAYVKTSSEKHRSKYKNDRTHLKDEYDSKYSRELDKINSDSKFQKPTKTKKK